MTKRQRKSCRRPIMLMCRACLVLLKPEKDIIHDLVKENGLAIKFLECTTIVLDAEDDLPSCLCDCCYQLVHKFHDFQSMCVESMLSFRKLLVESAFEDQEECEEIIIGKSTVVQPPSIAVGEIEEVYIINEDAESKNIENLTEHVPKNNELRTTTRNKLVCHICTQRFYKPGLLEAHLLRHQNEQPYNCVICDKNFIRQSSLRQHLDEVHAKPSTYKCEHKDCSKVYQSERSLIYHIRTQHNAKRASVNGALKKYICEQCGKSFTRQANLIRHGFVHLSKDERPYACSHCEKRFYTKQILLDHLNCHSGTKPFECPECGLVTTSRANLTVHMNTHTRRKIWKCGQCDKSFYDLSNFKSHKRVVHLGQRNYVCRFCNDRFSKPEHLRNHEMRHTGEKRYKCEQCGKGFIQLTPFKVHMRKVHATKITN